jgi:hypothetical protein
LKDCFSSVFLSSRLLSKYVKIRYKYIIIIIIIPFVLGPLACCPSELIWNYGSYRKSVGLLVRGIGPSQGRYLHENRQTLMTGLGFEPMISVFKRIKTSLALGQSITKFVSSQKEQKYCSLLFTILFLLI